MKPPAVGTPVTLREGRRRLFLVLVACLVFAATGTAELIGGDHSVTAWLATAFFGIGGMVIGVLVSRGGRTLRLDEVGMTIDRGLPYFGLQRVRWRDVRTFYVYQIPGQALVAYRLRPGAPDLRSKVRRGLEAVALTDAPDGNLPTVYAGMNASQLAGYLDRWRATAGGGSQ